MIRTQFQRHIRTLLQQMTAAEFRKYRAFRACGHDWADAMALGVILPDAASTLAAYQATGNFTHH